MTLCVLWEGGFSGLSKKYFSNILPQYLSMNCENLNPSHADSTGCAALLKESSKVLDSKRSLIFKYDEGIPQSPAWKVRPPSLASITITITITIQGEQLQCTAHTWLSPRHVLVAAEKGKVNNTDDEEEEGGEWWWIEYTHRFFCLRMLNWRQPIIWRTWPGKKRRPYHRHCYHYLNIGSFWVSDTFLFLEILTDQSSTLLERSHGGYVKIVEIAEMEVYPDLEHNQSFVI